MQPWTRPPGYGREWGHLWGVPSFARFPGDGQLLDKHGQVGSAWSPLHRQPSLAERPPHSSPPHTPAGPLGGGPFSCSECPPAGLPLSPPTHPHNPGSLRRRSGSLGRRDPGPWQEQAAALLGTTRQDVSVERPEQYMHHKTKGTVVTSGYASESPNVFQKHCLAAMESMCCFWLPLTSAQGF